MSEINAFTILMKGAKRCKRSRTTDSAGPTSTSKRAKTTEVLTIVIDDDSPEKSEYSHSTTLPEPSQLYSPEVYTKNVNKDLVWNGMRWFGVILIFPAQSKRLPLHFVTIVMPSIRFISLTSRIMNSALSHNRICQLEFTQTDKNSQVYRKH